MSKKKINLEDYITDATENVKSDRALALTLIADLMNNMNSNHDHMQLGQIAAKYLETLQRSNEQLVKLGGLVMKEKSSNKDLTVFDKEEIYELLKEDGNTDNG